MLGRVYSKLGGNDLQLSAHARAEIFAHWDEPQPLHECAGGRAHDVNSSPRGAPSAYTG